MSDHHRRRINLSIAMTGLSSMDANRVIWRSIRRDGSEWRRDFFGAPYLLDVIIQRSNKALNDYRVE